MDSIKITTPFIKLDQFLKYSGIALSGGVSLLGERVVLIAVAVLVGFLIAGFVAIARVQKKYNGGMF